MAELRNEMEVPGDAGYKVSKFSEKPVCETCSKSRTLRPHCCKECPSRPNSSAVLGETVMTKEQLNKIFTDGVNRNERTVTLNLPDQLIYLKAQDAHTRKKMAEALRNLPDFTEPEWQQMLNKLIAELEEK